MLGRRIGRFGPVRMTVWPNVLGRSRRTFVRGSHRGGPYPAQDWSRSVTRYARTRAALREATGSIVDADVIDP